MPELKPCPFCGCPEINIKWKYTDPANIFIEYKIFCKGCTANMCFERLSSINLQESRQINKLIDEWNSRILNE